MTIQDLRPNPGEHGVICGATGSGKSFLSRELLTAMPGRLAIIDPKREFDLPGVPIHSSIEAIKFFRPERFIFRPSEKLLFDGAQYDQVYRYCYRRGHFTVYTDDLIAVLQGQRWPYGLQLCYMLGRSKSVSTISAFQRPKRIPLFVLSEFTRAYIFHLEIEADELRARELIRNYESDSLPTYHFWYRNRRTMKEGTMLIIGRTN